MKRTNFTPSLMGGSKTFVKYCLFLLSFFLFNFNQISAQCTIIITEIMYNPDSPEDNWEWVEIYNPCLVDIDLTGYVIDDGNNTAHAAANMSGIIKAGESAVLFNVDDVTAVDFAAAWGTCPNALPVTEWSDMGLNNGGDQIGIWSNFTDYSGDQATHANTIFNLTYTDDPPWPADDGDASIYLSDLTADPNDGSNWALSTVGAVTPLGTAIMSIGAGTNSGMDIGSPCYFVMAGCNEAFFSEYVEGSSNNKGLEIYNPTGATIDLAAGNYVVTTFHNGNGNLASPNTQVALTGTIASGDVYLLAHASATFAGIADQTTGVGWFNGDDAVVLWKGGLGGTILDVIGQIGFDPGSMWGTGDASTQNNTIRRKSTVLEGDVDGTDPFDPAGEWDGFPQNDFTDLGSYSNDCIVIACDITAIAVDNISACNDLGTPDPTDDEFTYTVEITFDTPPATGDLKVDVAVAGVPDGTMSVAVGSTDTPTSHTFSFTSHAMGGNIDVSATFTDELACNMTVCGAGTAPISCSLNPCGELFFSEYIEGSGVNKCIEIYNPTTSAIDLDAGDYEVRIYFNGSNTAGSTIDLTGTVLAGDVFVICDDGAAADFLAQADMTPGNSFFNGDDAVELRRSNFAIDVLGQVGFDPGSFWSGGGVSTQNNTILRRINIDQGDFNPFDPFNPGLEWIEFPINTFDRLGFHCGDCTATEIIGIGVTNESCEGAADGSIEVYSVSVGDLEYSFDGGQTFSTTNGLTGQSAGCYDIVVRLQAAPECTISINGMIENGSPDVLLQVQELQIDHLSRISLGGAEILNYDAGSQQLYVTSGSGLQIVNISDPANPTLVTTVLPTSLGFNSDEITSVDVANGVIAAAVPDADAQAPGDVLLFDVSGNLLNSVQVGALPDMLTCTKNGDYVLVANEGEPGGGNDPDGSVSIINLTSGAASATVATATFTAFNGMEDDLRAQGVRIFPGVSTSADVEPEYIAISEDGNTAYVGLQENNAVAMVDIGTATVTSINSLGLKRHCEPGNALDASNEDGAINIKNWQVMGMYMPDGMSAYSVNGVNYLLTANEGDARDEDDRVRDLVLDPNAFPNAADLQKDENLGRLQVSTINGDTDGDGDFDQLYSYGARSFSIWDADFNQVYDSGDDLERITAVQTPALFNANDGDPAEFDNRSDDKGPEPEAVKVANIGGEYYAFVGLERSGSGFAVYNVTDPLAPYFITYVPCPVDDISTEDLVVIDASNSPNGQFLVAVASEESNTVSIYTITNDNCGANLPLAGIVNGGSGNYASYNTTITGGTASGAAVIDGNSATPQLDLSGATAGTVKVTITVTDDAGCTSSATETIHVGCDLGTEIADPCVCLNNAAEINFNNGNGGDNGQFSEQIIVTGLGGSPLPAGLNITVSNATNAFDAFAIPNNGVQSAGNAIVAGTALNYDAANSYYFLDFVHVEGVGYSITLMNNAQIIGTIGNTCYYPTPQITTDLPDAICLYTPAFTLEGNANGAAGTGYFLINGAPTNLFDPATLGVGSHLIQYYFDAGDALGYQVINGAPVGAPDAANTPAEAEADPGCVQGGYTSIQVIATPTSLSCNDNVQISLAEDCEVFVNPDMILDGAYGCFDDYTVSLSNSQGQPIANPINGNYLGELVTVNVSHLVSGNQCWGSIILEDKFAPTVTCQDYTITCLEDVNLVPGAVGDDNCELAAVNMVDETIVDTDACDDNQIVYRRTWIAIDAAGNESETCDQFITITRTTDVDFPNDVTWACENYNTYPNIVEATEVTASFATTGSGIPTNIQGVYCMYNYSHHDILLETCGFEGPDAPVFKIVRTWTVLDWCSGQVVTSNAAGEDNTQIIKVIDENGPTIGMMPFNLTANLAGEHPQPCASVDFIPAPGVLEDNCTGVVSLKIFTPAGEAVYINGVDGFAGGMIPLPGLEVGAHTITYVATDGCGNVTEYDVTVFVVDDLAPAAVCDEITEANLSSDGLVTVYAETFDDGSTDNCCLDYFAVDRGAGFGPHVTFTCDDVANNPLMVTFRAYDCDGNYNDCMVEVNVYDKLQPILVSCPDNQTISCEIYNAELAIALDDEDYSVLDQFGTPEFYDNCDVEVTPTVTDNVDQCGNGTITRTWNADDIAGNGPVSCNQIITVFHISDFEVEFPEDVTEFCEDQTIDFGEPTIFLETCELVAVSFEETLFNVVSDACYKIIRNYTVVNWCIYDQYGSNSEPDIEVSPRRFRSDDGYIEYEQVIKVTDTEAPEFTNGCAIDDVCILDNSCGATIILPMPEISDCSPDIIVTVTSDLGTGFGPFVNVPEGTYEVIYTAMDNCGNSNACSATFTVSDCKNPTPYCVNGLVVEIMNSEPPMIEVWAADFDAGSFDNCPGPVKISFSADVNDVSITFDCDQLGQQEIQLWATDAVGNNDFCTTFVEVQDNMNNCSGDPLNVNLGGTIATEDSEGVGEVSVELNSTANQVFPATSDDGSYFFNAIAGNDYTITPNKDINPLNGVSTFDMVLITKHILGTQLLDSPYKMIAADINNSGGITTFDLVQLRKLVLFIDLDFTSNTSWRFVDNDYIFPNPSNPWMEDFPEVININNLATDELEHNFVGVKIGDVNGSATPNQLLGADDRNFNGQLTFETADRKLVSGETVQLDFTASNFNHSGYQFTFQFDPSVLSFNGIQSGLAKEENFGLALLDEGIITASWNDESATQLDASDIVFTFNFTAKADADLANVIGINSRYTQAEAYALNGDLNQVNLDFTNTAVTTSFELFQNTPNPFEETTNISFSLPQATEATISISDVTGKVIWTTTRTFEQGFNQIYLKDKDLSATGVLYYQLTTDTHAASKKMIFLK